MPTTLLLANLDLKTQQHLCCNENRFFQWELLHSENTVLALYGIAVHSGIHKLPNWRNIHQIVHWKNRMKGIRCYMTAIMNKEGTEKHKKLKSRSICGKWSLNKILILIGTLVIGGIQVLRHQRGGWVGWPNDDVWWQCGWLGVA